MNIYQLLPVMAYGDAIGNETIALHHIIQAAGYSTHIYAEMMIRNRVSAEICSELKELKSVAEDDIIIYHLSTGSELNYKVTYYNCRLIVMYHNITPAHFFNGYSAKYYRNCRQGNAATEYLKDKVHYVLADSEFNRNELQKIGYTCNIDVLPILIPFKDYEQQPNKRVLEQFQDGRTNIIFTGRIAPNKKQEDIIAAFALYKKYYDSEARLFLVGDYLGMEQYYERLKQYIKELKVKDVNFTGHISFDEILAYYHVADFFLCMSEHEGFCVPLVEAMFFNIPIIAFNSTAVGSTLGGSGWLLDSKEPALVAAILNRLHKDETLRTAIIAQEQKRLLDFEYSKIQKQFCKYLQLFIDESVK